jgi:predicted DCC family thiol-disulfide oxidoreductase YuxK
MITVFHDGWCPLCTAVSERTKKLDARKKVQFVSFREPTVVADYALSPELLMKMEARLYVHDGKDWHEGISAVLKLARQIPHYWPLVPFIQLPIWTGAGQRLYDFIASRRSIVPTGHCTNGICEIPNRKVKR